MGKKQQPWQSLAFDAWNLGLESSSVIALRTTQALMGGDRSGREARLMIIEKMRAVAEIQSAFMTGALGADPAGVTKKVLRTYTRKVKANRRRLKSSG